jgi:hypothetical protein
MKTFQMAQPEKVAKIPNIKYNATPAPYPTLEKTKLQRIKLADAQLIAVCLLE